MRPALAVAVLAVVSFGCNKHRNDECDRYIAWAEEARLPLKNAVTGEEKAAAHDNEKLAAMYKKLAAGAHTAAHTPIPFTDPYVKSMAEQRLKIFEADAAAYEHAVAAFEKGDQPAVEAALKEEMDANAAESPLTDDWTTRCRL